MTIKKSAEYLGTVTMTRNELADATKAQQGIYSGIRYTHTQSYIDNVLAPLGSVTLSKLLKNTKWNLAGIGYNVWSLAEYLLIGMEETMFADSLSNGISSLIDLGAKWKSSWLEVEVQWGFLEVYDSSYGTGRFFMGNSSNPGVGYLVKRIRTSSGWMIL